VETTPPDITPYRKYPPKVTHPTVVYKLVFGSGISVSVSFQIIPRPVSRLRLGLGSGPHVVGRLGSKIWVSVSFCSVSRLGLGLGSETDVVDRSGSGPRVGAVGWVSSGGGGSFDSWVISGGGSVVSWNHYRHRRRVRRSVDPSVTRPSRSPPTLLSSKRTWQIFAYRYIDCCRGRQNCCVCESRSVCKGKRKSIYTAPLL